MSDNLGCLICAGKPFDTTYASLDGEFAHVECLWTGYKNCSDQLEATRREMDTLRKKLGAFEVEARIPKTFTFRGMSETELTLMMEHYRDTWDIVKDLAHTRKAWDDANKALFQAGVVAGKAHMEGLKEGIRRFAWWKDGVQYVGSCGTTLKQALKEVDPNP